MRLPVEAIPCPVCQQPGFSVIHSHIDRIDTPGTQVVRCTGCGLVYLTPRLKLLSDSFTLSEAYLSQDYLPDQIKRGLLHPDGRLHHENNLAYHAGRLEQIRPYRRTNCVLDVGCAIGLFLAATRHDGWESYGIEPSHALGEFGRSQFGLEIDEGELPSRRYPDHSFDVVTLWEVIEHLTDPQMTLREAYRVLRPGGLLLLSTPNWHSLEQEMLGAKWDNFVTDHFQFFTQATLRQALGQVGFTHCRTATGGLNAHEITRKLGRRAALSAQRYLASARGADQGRTLTAAAEKPDAAGSIIATHASPSIFFLSGSDISTSSHYRVLHKQEQLGRLNSRSIARAYPFRLSVMLEEALAYDVICLYRVPFDAEIEGLIEQARNRGIPVIFDTDDLVFDPELVQWVDSLRRMSSEEAAHYYEGVWRYRQTLLACDAVITSTDFLAERARTMGKTAYVHRNALGGALIQAAARLRAQRLTQPSASEKLVIGYGSGTDTHRRDFAVVADALAEIMNRHPNVELRIIGPMVLPESLSRFGTRVSHFPLVNWYEWLRLLSSFDINLAPLEYGNPFCRGKSEIKYIEAAVLGIPTVASRIDAYEFAIHEGENGFLAGNTLEWVEQLERLVIEPELRGRIGEAARRDVLTRCTPGVRSQELATMLDAIVRPVANHLASKSAVTAPPHAGPLVLNWVFTEPIPGSGGHASIIRIMNLLASFGHQINIYTVPYKHLRHSSDLEIREFVRRHFGDLNGHVVKWLGGPMSASDAVILTYWDTAYLIGNTQNTSKIFYFVQDWEPFFYPMGPQYLRAERTYQMGFSCLTEGPWLAQHLKRRYQADADHFDLAVDHDVYYPRPKTRRDRPRLCFYARPSTPRRLAPIGIAALSLVHAQRSDVEIVLYGAVDSDLAALAIPFPFINLGILSETQLAELYSSSDVGLVLSSTNCSLVPLEMMACKCAVVDLNRETVQGVLAHDENAVLADPTPQSIAEAIVRLLDDQALRQRLVETGYRQVQVLSWEKSARQVEAILYQKLPASRRLHDPVLPRFSSPALADLPSEQRQYLDVIHTNRRRWTMQLWAGFKLAAKRLLRVESGGSLSFKLIAPTGELTGHRTIGQTFVARLDNLCRIDVLVGTYHRRNTRDVIFHLRESPTSLHDLATARASAGLLRDTSYCSFSFEPQAGSRHKSYYFFLESPESVRGDAITLWAYRHVNLPDATLYKSQSATSGQLVFGMCYGDGQFGEVGERPLLNVLTRNSTFWDRIRKAYRLLVSQGVVGLVREIRAYRRWRSLGKP